MAKAKTAERAELRLVTMLVQGDADLDIEGVDIIHDQTVDLDEPELSGTGNSFKAAYASIGGNEAPMATVRIDGKVVKCPLTIVQSAYFSKKAVDKAKLRG